MHGTTLQLSQVSFFKGVALSKSCPHPKRGFINRSADRGLIHGAMLLPYCPSCQDQADVQEVGRVLSVGDGIARIYGLKGVKAAAAVLG